MEVRRDLRAVSSYSFLFGWVSNSSMDVQFLRQLKEGTDGACNIAPMPTRENLSQEQLARDRVTFDR